MPQQNDPTNIIDSQIVPDQADSSVLNSNYSLERPSENHDAPIHNSITQNDTDIMPEPQRPEWEIPNTIVLNYQEERPPNINGVSLHG